MARRLYAYNRVRYWYAYDLDEICTLFADLNLHVQTVRKWIKNGLATIDHGKPALVYGQNLIAFLKAHNQTNKRRVEFDEFYCMACQDARRAFSYQISVEQNSQFLKVQGVCRSCKARMFKNYSLQDFAVLKRQFKMVDVVELYDDVNPTVKTQIRAEDESGLSESIQSDLFL